MLEVAPVEGHEWDIVHQAGGRDPQVIRKNGSADGFHGRRDESPYSANCRLVIENQDVGQPALKLG